MNKPIPQIKSSPLHECINRKKNKLKHTIPLLSRMIAKVGVLSLLILGLFTNGFISFIFFRFINRTIAKNRREDKLRLE